MQLSDKPKLSMSDKSIENQNHDTGEEWQQLVNRQWWYLLHEGCWTQAQHQLLSAVGQLGSCNDSRDDNSIELVACQCCSFHERYW